MVQFDDLQFHPFSVEFFVSPFMGSSFVFSLFAILLTSIASRGNIRYRTLIEQYKPRYNAASRVDKVWLCLLGGGGVSFAVFKLFS